MSTSIIVYKTPMYKIVQTRMTELEKNLICKHGVQNRLDYKYNFAKRANNIPFWILLVLSSLLTPPKQSKGQVLFPEAFSSFSFLSCSGKSLKSVRYKYGLVFFKMCQVVSLKPFLQIMCQCCNFKNERLGWHQGN